MEQTAVLERVHKWLGDLPSGWTGARLFQVADAWTSNVDKHTVEGQPPVRLCNYVDVYKNNSIVDSLDFMAATATRDQIKRFRIRVGDTLITKDSETADDIGVPAFVEYEADNLICGYHLAIIRPDRGKAAPKFLYWTLGSEPIARQWGVTAAGVTRVGIRSTDLNKVTIPLPPLEEQRAIADYLDHETAQIDALVAKQEEFIRLLTARRASAIDSLVWSGVNQTVDLTGAGIGPKTVSPSHWRRLRNKNLFRETSVASKDGREELLTVSHLTGVTPRSMKNVNMFESVTTEGYKVVEVGDLAINTMWAWMGALGVSNYGGVVSPAYGVYRPIVKDIDGRYFDHLYRTARYVVEMTRYSRGVTSSRLRLYPDSFLRLNVVVPPKSEQTAIADQIEDQTTRIDSLIGKAEEHIALAMERRSALITAAVTGQFEIRMARKAS